MKNTTLALLCTLLLTTAVLAQAGTVPVAVGGHGDLDACMSQGQAKAPNADSGELLPVRVGPGAEYEQFGELEAGDVVNICDESGGWIGIVYGARDCGVGGPIAERKPYIGVCMTGWVPEKFIDVTAG